MNTEQKPFLAGVRDGIPIALGYLAVGFSLGFAAKGAGLNALQGFLASLLTYASAGEYAAFHVIASQGAYLEMMLVILVTNCRYMLMSAALSQRVRPSESLFARFAMGGVVTDEIFGISIGQKGFVPPRYMWGAAAIAIPSWALGTMLGIIMGNLLPAKLVSALGVALYGMFIAVVVPEAKQNRTVCLMCILSFAASYGFSVLPGLKTIDGGFRIIILTLVIAGIFALLVPVKEEEDHA